MHVHTSGFLTYFKFVGNPSLQGRYIFEMHPVSQIFSARARASGVLDTYCSTYLFRERRARERSFVSMCVHLAMFEIPRFLNHQIHWFFSKSNMHIPSPLRRFLYFKKFRPRLQRPKQIIFGLEYCSVPQSVLSFIWPFLACSCIEVFSSDIAGR